MKITRKQLRRIIREASSFHAEERGMAAAYRQGYNDAYRGPGSRRRTDDPEYRRGYETGLADSEAGKPPPEDLKPAMRRRRR